MSEWKARRFWTTVATRPAEGGVEITLDDRVLRTPGKKALTLPTQPLAEAVAEEWRAQGELIQPLTMPLTRAVNSTVEKVVPQFEAVAAMLAEYGGTDLLSYRATEPEALIRRQAEAWDPLIDWSAQVLGAPLRVTQGVIPVPQEAQSQRRLHDRIAALDPWGLTALHDLVTIPGSLVIGLAVTQGRLAAAEAHALSRIDEDFQAEQWGSDEEAQEAAAARLLAMEQAERLWLLSRRG
ncbi:ATP12 family chaperone protein [Paracoccus sp. ME4]|uniref:ATP12 family chaperone protein n=1 Tax=Paracoccus sp. ME4 TaxID=3138066 RepID=UPI00398B7AF8